MTPNELKTLLDAIQQGTVTAHDAHDRLLDYLRRQDVERYRSLIAKLGLRR